MNTTKILALVRGTAVEEHMTELTDEDFDASLISNAPLPNFISRNNNMGRVYATEEYAIVDDKIIDYNKIPYGSKYTTAINGSACIIIVSGNGNKTVRHNGMFVMEF